MTIREFYDWAVEHDVEDFTVLIQYRDSGGYYIGYNELLPYDIEIDRLRCEVTI